MPKYTATTWLVVTAVTVSDRNGRSIEGLSPNSFAATEDGVPQSIKIFEFQKVAAGPQSTATSSYYIVGYYTSNGNADGKFRKIQITGKEDSMTKLDYRAGYYANKSLIGPGASGTGGDGVDRGIIDATHPILIFKKDPEYSEEARKAKYQGTVVFSVEVNDSGQVTNIKVVRSLGLGLDEKAIEAVKQWKFRPGMKQGQAVTVQAQVEVNFRLL